MNRLQFSLTGLILAVFVLAIACAALMLDVEWASSAALTVQFVFLVMGIVGILARQGPRRLFWVGFSVLAWFYFFCSIFQVDRSIFHVEPYKGTGTAPTMEPLVHQLPTDKLLRFLFTHRKITPREGALVEASVRGNSFVPARIFKIHDDGEIEVQWGERVGDIYAPWNGPWASVTLSGIRGDWNAYRSTGHAVFCPLIALLGGFLARMIFARDEEISRSSNQKETSGDNADETAKSS